MSPPLRSAGTVLLAVVLSAAATTSLQAQAEPEMATAPEQFRAGLSGGPFLWSDGSPTAPSDEPLWGLGVERHILDLLSIRFEFAYGGSEVSTTGRSTDVKMYLAEVLLGGRLAIGSLREAGVIPFASVGIGSLLHDPSASDLGTRSQNAFSWGGGLEARLGGDFGARAEWRRYTVQLENLFEPTDRSATARRAHRVVGALYWEF